MKIPRHLLLATPIGVAAALALAQPSLAAMHDEERAEALGGWHGDSHSGWRRPHFGERRPFDDHDWTLWRGGHWAHERHDGRFGWWWVAGDDWFIYPDPVYPYPDPDVMPQQDATPDQDPVGLVEPTDPTQGQRGLAEDLIFELGAQDIRARGITSAYASADPSAPSCD